VLKDFVRPDMLRQLEAETERLSPNAHINATETNPYNSAGDPTLPPEHPRNRFDDRTNGFDAGDRIGADPLPVLILGATLAAFVRILSVLRGWQAPKAPGPRD
jgi:hypothetical protein